MSSASLSRLYLSTISHSALHCSLNTLAETAHRARKGRRRKREKKNGGKSHHCFPPLLLRLRHCLGGRSLPLLDLEHHLRRYLASRREAAGTKSGSFVIFSVGFSVFGSGSVICEVFFSFISIFAQVVFVADLKQIFCSSILHDSP